MPVYRFRDSNEARRALWVATGAPELPQRMRRLWAFLARLGSRRVRPGVRKFRSIEEANRDRATWGWDPPGSG